MLTKFIFIFFIISLIFAEDISGLNNYDLSIGVIANPIEIDSENEAIIIYNNSSENIKINNLEVIINKNNIIPDIPGNKYLGEKDIIILTRTEKGIDNLIKNNQFISNLSTEDKLNYFIINFTLRNSGNNITIRNENKSINFNFDYPEAEDDSVFIFNRNCTKYYEDLFLNNFNEDHFKNCKNITTSTPEENQKNETAIINKNNNLAIEDANEEKSINRNKYINLNKNIEINLADHTEVDKKVAITTAENEKNILSKFLENQFQVLENNANELVDSKNTRIRLTIAIIPLYLGLTGLLSLILIESRFLETIQEVQESLLLN